MSESSSSVETSPLDLLRRELHHRFRSQLYRFRRPGLPSRLAKLTIGNRFSGPSRLFSVFIKWLLHPSGFLDLGMKFQSHSLPASFSMTPQTTPPSYVKPQYALHHATRLLMIGRVTSMKQSKHPTRIFLPTLRVIIVLDLTTYRRYITKFMLPQMNSQQPTLRPQGLGRLWSRVRGALNGRHPVSLLCRVEDKSDGANYFLVQSDYADTIFQDMVWPNRSGVLKYSNALV